jgi:hypothetical protein
VARLAFRDDAAPSLHNGLAAGSLLGRDYWARADAFIAKRLSGEIERGPGSSVEYCL